MTTVSNLSEICELINRGITPKYNIQGNIRLVKSAHVKTESIDWINCPFIEGAFDKYSKFELKNGDILLNGTGTGSIGRSGIVFNKPQGTFLPDSHVNLIRVDKKRLDPYYLFFWLNTPSCRAQLEKLITGSTNQVELSAKKVGQLAIPLVPLGKQIESVDKLKTALKVLKLKNKQKKLLDEFLKASFLEIFGDPHFNEKQFPTFQLKELGIVTTGNTPSRRNQDYYGKFIEWIKTDNITDQVFLTPAAEYLSEAGLKVCRSVSTGSILVACIAGGITSIGKCALVDRTVAFNQQINAFTPSNKILSSYFYNLIKIAKDIVQNSSQTGMKKIVTKSNFEKIKIPVPPLKDQQKFNTVFKQYLVVRKKIDLSIDGSEDLFNSLMQKSFLAS